MTRVAIFASGAGSNAAKIIEYFRGNSKIEIALIVCNKPNAGVIEIARNNGLPCLMIEKENFFRGTHYLDELASYKINFIVLAGFLWKVPTALVAAFPDRIVNIHPALLPSYGGKGMYGNFVHEAVIQAGEIETGITIHVVDEKYDNGKTIFQATCPVMPEDTPDALAARIHELEHEYYPKVIEKYIQSITLNSSI